MNNTESYFKFNKNLNHLTTNHCELNSSNNFYKENLPNLKTFNNLNFKNDLLNKHTGDRYIYLNDAFNLNGNYKSKNVTKTTFREDRNFIKYPFKDPK